MDHLCVLPDALFLLELLALDEELFQFGLLGFDLKEGKTSAIDDEE